MRFSRGAVTLPNNPVQCALTSSHPTDPPGAALKTMFPFITFIPGKKWREEGCDRLLGGAWQNTCSDFQNTTGSFIWLFWHCRVEVEVEASALTITQVCLILFHLHASKTKVSVQVKRDSADFKGCWGEGGEGGGCGGVPGLSCSLLFFAQSCKSKQELLPELNCCGACARACVLHC